MLGLALLHFGATPATAQPDTAASPRVAGCVGTSFAGTLGNGKAICNGNYLVRMQGNGDLVLRVISTGRACWTSGTAGAWSNDASATFNKNIWGRPYVDIDKASQGRIGRVVGAHTPTTFGTNANVNSRGEFWIGFKKIASC
ncbi:hypothetical protein [Jiangella alba]|uniref:Peptidase inhibitor family I36 n=1 Tax=Jiangella alba TaxID=561176 RepID=A0A1H5KKD3_9ACTN|nr:hypothetical protein [Jiangella alba]SEE65272.1 hypothetical protein SAMN04488561_2119 [Jiangella alba]